MVVGNQEIYAVTCVSLNEFKGLWPACLLIPLALRWIQRDTSGPLG